LNLCDKVGDEGQDGYAIMKICRQWSQHLLNFIFPSAHAVVAAILKRLAHRNPNVQLYALSLSESLGKNLGLDIHREIASRVFTQGLEKLITDRVSNLLLRISSLG